MRVRRVLLVLLTALHAAALMPAFLAPYDPAAQYRDHALAPPEGTRWAELEWLPRDTSGNLHLFGFRSRPHFLLGADNLGRDQLSRLLYALRASLFAGLMAALISLGLAVPAGIAAGYWRGWPDAIFLRASELFLALPWVYLLVGVRSALPLNLESMQAWLLVSVVTGVIGWARPARLIRGVVLSAVERDSVIAARGFGAGAFYLVRRHILPAALSTVVTQAALLVPQYVMAEAGLSFLGIGVSEPMPSLGNMLGALRHYYLIGLWWMYMPAFVLGVVVLLYDNLAGLTKDLSRNPTQTL